MPRPTWFNLPADKRGRVVDAAMREFGAHGFSGGSLNAIAGAAGVAKGSLFQYFDDKLALFAYVCDVCSTRIRDAMLARMEQRDTGQPLFDLLRVLTVDWIDYFRAHPVERGVTFATNFEMDPAVRATVRRVVNRHYRDVLDPLLKSARDRGELRDDVDLDHLLALLILLLPHLALAPHAPELDPVLELHGATPDEAADRAGSLLAALERAFAPHGGTP